MVSSKNTKTKKAWGGRFDQKSNPLLERFNASLPFDRRMYREDIAGSVAHARMLSKIGVLTASEFKKIEKGLGQVLKEIDTGKFEWSDSLEDIHMAVETRLTKLIGPLGGKLHTARSRNDQVALDLRLYTRTHVQKIQAQIRAFQKVLVKFAETEGWVALPGYTHLQRAQPIYLAHHLLAYFEMFERDFERLENALTRINTLPLGSGALAGTTFPIKRELVAKELNFDRISQNSLDAVSDRDFVAETLFALTLLQTHLSRMAEELVLWASQEFQFVSLPQEFCTGSSMMPQKINPDVPELVRGKTGRVLGYLVSIFTVLKGLPLAYNKDLQEDKEPLFDAFDTLSMVLEVMTAMFPGIRVRAEKMSEANREGFLLATDLADYLVSKKIPFREAHEIVGLIIRYCLEHKTVLESLSVSQLQKFSTVISSDVQEWLTVEASLSRRSSLGGTAQSQVKAQIKRAKKLLSL